MRSLGKMVAFSAFASLLSFMTPLGSARAAIGTIVVTPANANQASITINHPGYLALPESSGDTYRVCWKKVGQFGDPCWFHNKQDSPHFSFYFGLTAGLTYEIKGKCRCKKDSPWAWLYTWQEAGSLTYTHNAPIYLVSSVRYRLRHSATGQCGYIDPNGAMVRHWVCWNDPWMVFKLESYSNGVKFLRHEKTGFCIWGENPMTGQVRGAQCGLVGTSFAITQTGGGKFKLAIPFTKQGNQFGVGGCMFSTGGNGGQFYKQPCGSSPVFDFHLDPA